MKNLGIHCNKIEHFEQRIIENGLNWGEFFNLPPQYLKDLRSKVKDNGTTISVHLPLIEPSWYPFMVTWSLLNDLDPDRRELTFRLVEETLQAATDLNPRYVVVHFPTPVSREFANASPDVIMSVGRASAERLAKLSEKYGTPIAFEGFGPSPLFSTDFLIEVATTYPSLHYCLDCAHMFMASQREGFDYFDFVRTMAPYLGTLHLWNTRGLNDYLSHRHIPVHPTLRPEDGWVDVEGTLRLVREVNPDCPVIIEHGDVYPPDLGPKDYREGVEWIKQIVETLP